MRSRATHRPARTALVLPALLASLGIALPAAAQVAVDPIAVSGVAHPRDEAGSDQPIDVLGAAEIARTGAADLGEALARLPEFGGQGVDAANADGYGAEFIDLRNLNFNRTLTLVDGERFVLTGIRTDEAVDFNNIPLALVDHVDILADGSQPVWGPDAVAGAVNVVLKHRFDGLAIDGDGGSTTGGGASTGQVTITGGRTIGAVSLLGSVGFQDRDPLPQSERSWSAAPIASAAFGGPPVVGSPATPGGHAVTSDGAIDDLLLGGGRSRPFDPATDDYVDTAQQDLLGGTRRINVDGMLTWTLTPTLVASTQLILTERRTDQLAPPQALGLSGTEAFPQGFVVPPGAAGDPFDQDVLLERVLGEVGAQRTTTEGPTLRVLSELHGLAGPVGWRLVYDHGQSALRYSTTNSVDLADVFASLGQGADYFGPGTLSPAQAAAIRYTDVSDSRYREDVAQGTATADLPRLWSAAPSLLLGGELRFEHGRTSVSPVVAAGAQSVGDAAPTGGGYLSRDLFADLRLPVLRDARLARSLEADVSGRVSVIDRLGTLLTWKAVAGWAPDRLLRLRATVGLARRPPAITESFGGIAANYVAVDDPCDASAGLLANPTVAANCRAIGLPASFRQASPLIDIASGGDPALRAEASRSATLGAVLTPPALPHLVLSADWYDYRIKNAIDSLADTDPDTIPDACFTSPNLSSPLCGLISRAPSGASIGQIDRILALDQNVGTIETSGLDFDAAWRGAIGAGALALDWRTTWLLDWRIREEGSAGFTQYAGTFPSLVDVGSYTRLRSLASADYAIRNWNLSWQERLIGGASVLGAAPGTALDKAGPVFTADVSISRRLGRVLLSAGVDNLFDTPPPTLVDGVTNTDVNTYDVLGRFVYARFSVTL